MSVVQADSSCRKSIGWRRSRDGVSTCLFNLSLFGPVRRSNRTTENSNQATQIALQLVTHACLSAFKVSEDNSIRLDTRICGYLNERETENVFFCGTCYLVPTSGMCSVFPLHHTQRNTASVTLRFKQQPPTSFQLRYNSKSVDLRGQEIWSIGITLALHFF